jgi:hypothetical protein
MGLSIIYGPAMLAHPEQDDVNERTTASTGTVLSTYLSAYVDFEPLAHYAVVDSSISPL